MHICMLSSAIMTVVGKLGMRNYISGCVVYMLHTHVLRQFPFYFVECNSLSTKKS